jgi:hypothetical protein
VQEYIILYIYIFFVASSPPSPLQHGRLCLGLLLPKGPGHIHLMVPKGPNILLRSFAFTKLCGLVV